MSEQTGSWQPDPFGRHQYRYWDGAAWTDQVADEGVAGTDPPVSDPTTPLEQPAQADTPHEPVPPVASSEPAPVEQSAATDDGGNNALPIIVGAVIVALLLLGTAVYFLVIAGDDDDLRTEFVASLQRGYDMDSDEAECVADELEGTVGLERVANAIDAGREPTGTQRAAFSEAFDQCGVDDAPFTTDSADGGRDDDTQPPTTDDDSPPDTDEGPNGLDLDGIEFSPAMVAMMAQQVASQLGITQAQAECYLTEILDEFTLEEMFAIGQDPSVMEDSDMAEVVLDIFDRCGIDPSDLG